MNSKLFVFPLSLLIGCSTTTKSIGTGAVVGGSVGALIGHHRDGTTKSKIIGASSGALLGGLAGYFAKKSQQKRRHRELKTPSKHSLAESPPNLTQPKVSMYWEPDKIEGNKYIEKHRVWVLKTGAHWTR